MSLNPPPPLVPEDPWIAAQRRDYAERCLVRMTGCTFSTTPRLPTELEARQTCAIMAGVMAYVPDAPPPDVAIGVTERLKADFGHVADYLALTLPELVLIARLFSCGSGEPKSVIQGLGLFATGLFEAQGNDELERWPLQLLIDRARAEAEVD